MTDAEYIKYELSKGRPTDPDYTIRIKATSNSGESRWVLITREQFEAVITALTTEKES